MKKALKKGIALTSLVNTNFSISSFITVGNRLGAVFLMGIMFIFVARTLGPKGQGIVATLVALITIAIQFGNLGLYASNIRFVGADKKLFSKAAGNSLTIGLMIGTLMSIFLIGSAYAYPSLIPNIPFALLLLYSISLPFSLITILFQGMLLSVSDILRYNILIFLRAFSLMVGVIIILTYMGAGLWELIAYLVAVEILFAIAYVGVCYLKSPFGPTLDKEYIKKMMVYGIKVFAATQLTYLVLKFDILMVNYYLLEEATGIYSVSSKLADMVKMIPETIALLFFPMATTLKDRARPFANKVLLAVSVLMIFICIGCYFGGEMIIAALFGPAYSGSVTPFLILIPGIYFISLEVLLMNYFAAKDMPLFVVFVPLIGLATNVGLNMLWLPIYGINGAAYSSTVSYLLMFALMAWKYLKSK